MQDPKSQAYYTRQLKAIIPKEAMKPATYKLIPMFVHAGLIGAEATLIRTYPSNWLIVLLGAVGMGISIACLFLYCHEMSHGTIIRKQPWYYLLQNFFWAFSGIPPTMWKRVHNYSHHHHMNTPDDPDRKTFQSEANGLNKLYNLFIYPNKRLRYSLTVGFAMMFYSAKHILAVFYPHGSKPKIVTYRPAYSQKEVFRVARELTYIVLFWLGIMLYIHSWVAPLVCFIAWSVYSAGVITFIITQHLRDPVFKEVADPLLVTTSVVIPAWLDRLIDWHSFHVEHHLFPGINFDYYPQLSLHLAEKFPDRYDRIPLLQAIREAYDKEVLLDDPLV